MANEFDAIALVTDAAFEAELGQMQNIVQREVQVREAIEDLEGQAKDAVMRAGAVEGMPALGADQLWRSWLLERRRVCQMELATILADKADALVRLSAAFGRANVAAKLKADDGATSRHAAASQALFKLQDLMMRKR